MKNLSLPFLYMLVLGLLIYSCTREEMVPAEIADNKIKLISPNNFVLASSEASLVEMMKENLAPFYGREYEFEINHIDYSSDQGMTQADVYYTTIEGRERNIIFYWFDKNSTQANSRLFPVIILVAPVCVGTCAWDAPDCTTKYNFVEKVYRCTCIKHGDAAVTDCEMKVPPGGTGGDGGTISCAGSCTIVDDDDDLIFPPCQAVFNPHNGDADCYCNGSAHGDCGPPTID